MSLGNRRVSSAGRALIKAHEGLRLQAYPDPASGGHPWTIGYGHTSGVKPGDKITEEEADAFLAEDLVWVEHTINALVKVPLTQPQFDALASLIFNIGARAFEKSTLLRLLNSGDYLGASVQFERWVHAAGKVMPGLRRRRREERDLFLSETPRPAPEPLVQPGPEPIPTGEAPDWPPPTKEPSVDPFTSVALSAVLKAAPDLINLFKGDSKAATRNAEAAKLVVEVAKDAVAARNEQDLVSTLAESPEAVATVQQAVRENWYDIQQLTEAGGGGIEGAGKRDAATRSAGDMLQSPSFWIALALLPLVYMIVGNVVGVLGKPLAEDVRAAISNGVAGLILGGLIGYYYGQTTSRNRK